MAVYTPAVIYPLTQLTGTSGASDVTGVNGTTYLVRCIHFLGTWGPLAGVSFSVGGTVAAAVDLFADEKLVPDAVALTWVPKIFIGGWVRVSNGATVDFSAKQEHDANISHKVNVMACGHTYA